MKPLYFVALPLLALSRLICGVLFYPFFVKRRDVPPTCGDRSSC